MPGCIQTSKSRKVRIQSEAFCSCRDNNGGIGKRLSCSCGEELNGMYELVFYLKEDVLMVYVQIFNSDIFFIKKGTYSPSRTFGLP
jgi:hypothetical protein